MRYWIQQENPATTDYNKSVRTITPRKYNKYNILLQLLKPENPWHFTSSSSGLYGSAKKSTVVHCDGQSGHPDVTRTVVTLQFSEIGTAALGHKKRKFLTDRRPLSVWRARNSSAPACNYWLHSSGSTIRPQLRCSPVLGRDNKLVYKNKTYIIMVLIRAIPINRGLALIMD